MIEKLNRGVSAELFEPSEKNKFELNQSIIFFDFQRKSIFGENNDRGRDFLIEFRSTDRL